MEVRPSSPSTCRLCVPSSRRLFRPHASGDGTRMQSVLSESGSSYRLSHSRVGSKLKLTAAAVQGARRQLLTMAHTFTATSTRDSAPRIPGRGPGECGLACDNFSLRMQQRNWCSLDELSFSCSSRVLLLLDELYHCIIVLE